MSDSPYPSALGRQVQDLVRDGKPAELAALFEGVDPSSIHYGMENPWFWIVRSEHPLATKQALLSCLIDAGSDVDSRCKVTGETAFVQAVLEADFDLTRFLRSRGASTRYTAAEWCVFVDSRRLLRFIDRIPDLGVAVDDIGGALLCAAIKFSELSAVRELLARGVPANATTNQYGWPVLVSACHRADRPIIEALLAAGAEVDARTPDGQTGLMRAASEGDRQIIDRLLERGADPGLTDAAGKTATGYTEDPELVAYLVSRGCPAPDTPLAPVAHHVVRFVATDGDREVDFEADFSAWAELVRAAGAVMETEPEQTRAADRLVCEIRPDSPLPFDQLIARLADEAFLSKAVVDRLG